MDKKTQTIDMKMFAKNAGANISYSPGSVIFKEGDVSSCIYIIQSGVIEIVTHDRVTDVCGPGDVMGFMSLIDGGANTASARVKEAAEVSIIDERKFHFMIDEVPNFAFYIMKALAHRVRGMHDKI